MIRGCEQVTQLLVGSVIGMYFWQRSSLKMTTKTIAVLPFKSLVAEERDEELELGMADALISKLSEAAPRLQINSWCLFGVYEQATTNPTWRKSSASTFAT